MGRGVYRGIYSALPDDVDFQQLSTNAKLVFYTIRLCHQAGPAAIFRYYPAMIAIQTGLTLPAVTTALDELAVKPADRPWVIKDDLVLWIRNGLRHDPMMRLSDKKHRRSIELWLAGLPRTEVVLRFCDYYVIGRPFEDPTQASSKGLRRPLSPTPTPSPSPKGGSGGKQPELPAGFALDPAFFQALDQLPRFTADRKLRDPAWWQAMIQAYPTIDHIESMKRAHGWLVTKAKGKRMRDYPAFLRNWFERDEGEQGEVM